MLTSSSILPPYSHKIKPFAHQLEVLDLSYLDEYFAVFMEMGTGKSKVMIDTMAKLFLEQQIDGVLIVAPKGGFLNWCDEEIPAHMPEWLPKRMAYHGADMPKLEERISYALLAPQDNCLDIMCMNIEALTTDRYYNFAETFIRSHYTLIIIDESTCIKNHKAKRSKAMYKLGKLADYRRILTGTPITNDPLDLYGQCEFLKPGLLGFDNWVSFQNHFAEIRQMTNGSRRYDMIVKYKNLNELTDRIQQFAYRKLKSECLDLPDKIFVNHFVQQSPEQKEAYEKMSEEAMIMFGKEDMVSSTSVITTMMKLHQINCGHVKDDFGNTHDIPNNRIKDLIEILRSTKKKVIIWCNFIRDVELIAAAIKEEFGRGPALYYGASSVEDRRQALQDFKYGHTNHFVSTLSTGAKALTIVESSFTVYYSYDYNLEKWLQSQDRNHRPGQNENVTYVVMQIPKTVDSRMIKALKTKEDLASQVLDNWRELIS